MNYLAHLFLSGVEEEIIVGNMMEDFVVGKIDHPRHAHLSDRIKIGIQLHRLIDTFMDTHDSVKDCKSILYPKYHKYASVVIDIFFDHFLATNWAKYTNEDFTEFRLRMYEAFENQWDVLPPQMQPVIESMIHHDWLKNYSEFWGIERALLNVSKRAVHQSGMENAVEDLKLHYEAIKSGFEDFFPKMLKECNDFIDKNRKRDKRKIIENYIDAYNHFDIERMLIDLDEQIVFSNISNGEENLKTEGIENFKNQAIQATTYFSARKQSISNYLEKNDYVELDIDYVATLAINFPNGLKKGDEIKLIGKSIISFNGDKIIEIQDIS